MDISNDLPNCFKVDSLNIGVTLKAQFVKMEKVWTFDGLIQG